MAETQVRRKVLRRFYEPLLLLHSLGQIRGQRIKSETNINTLSPNIHRLRRCFVDGLAYICSYEKGPSCVTAVALERTPQGIVVWVAGNEKVGKKVIQFLESVLSDVQRISEPNDRDVRQREGERIEEYLTSRIIAFNTSRLTYYNQMARKRASACFDVISKRNENSDRTRELAEWLRDDFVTNSSSISINDELQALVRICYKKRRGSAFDTLKCLAGQGETHRLDFEKLYEFLGKLGQHVHVAKKLIEAAVSLSQDFVEGFCIKTLPSSKEQKLPLTPKEATIESTIRRMFSNSADQRKFMDRLQSIWDPAELSRVLQKQHTTKTRVHAELLLLDHFDKNGCTFLDNNDKYIGCSKPACYLCHAYITHHPGRYAVPSSHQKLYMGWRHPDIDSNATACRAQQEQIMLKLIEWVRRDIATDIESRTKRLPYHADTAGMSTLSKSTTPKARSLLDLDTYAAPEEFQAQSDTPNTSDIPKNGDEDDDDDDDGGVRLDQQYPSP